MSWSATLSFGDTEIEIGDGSSSGGYNATSGGIEGWYSTPEAKWALTEKTTAHGAYGLFSEDEILYAARVVTLHLWAEGSTRREVVANKLALLACAGQEVELQVRDGDCYMHVDGYATIEDAGGALSSSRDEMTLTIECPDPYRIIDAVLLAEYSASGASSEDFEVAYTTVTVNGANAKFRKYTLSSVLFSEDAYPVLHIAARSTPVTYVYFEATRSETSLTALGDDLSLAEVTIDWRYGTAVDGDGNDVSELFEGFEVDSIDAGITSDVSIITNALVDIEVEFWDLGAGKCL